MSKLIPLTQGQFAIVDDEDFDWLNQFKWYYEPTGCGYAARRVNNKAVSMHRFIMQAQPGQEIDHYDGNGLNNQRANLRFATGAQNSANKDKPRRVKKAPTSRFKGVCWSNQPKHWRAQIRVRGIKINIGSFDDEIEAARTYDAAACKYHGAFARLNFPESTADHQELLRRARQWGHLPSLEELGHR